VNFMKMGVWGLAPNQKTKIWVVCEKN